MLTHSSWWLYDMEMLSSLLALCEGNPLDSPHKGPVMRRYDGFFFVKPEQAIGQTAESSL